MNLSQAEIIQVLRRRSNLNQGDFGAQAFNTSYESGRTKVKNLELGKQIPTTEDINKMAQVLGVEPAELLPVKTIDISRRPQMDNDGMAISPELLACFPGLAAYLEMLDKAVRIGDAELISHIAEKAAAILTNQAIDASPAVKTGTIR